MKMHNSGRLPEFLLTVTFPVALGVYRAAEELGMKIPGDLDIISFGNSGLNQFLSPPMSYIEQPTVELGRKAVELTVESIQQKNEFSPQKIILPTKLVLCKTCIGNGML
jgi:LacI family transcriptional regulator